MGKRVSKKQKTSTKKLHVSRGLKFIGGFFGIIAIGYLIYFASWTPQYIEVGKIAEDPMASKSLLGMKLKSSHENHAIPASRSFLGKPRSAAVYRYFYMPDGETQDSLIAKLRKEAEKNGWVVDSSEQTFDNYIVAYKGSLVINIGIDANSEYSPVYVIIEKG